MSLIILAALSVVTAALCHHWMKGLFAASLTAAAASSIGVHLVGFVVEGSFDSLVLISLMTSFLIAFVIALALGWLSRLAKRKRGVNSHS